MERFLDFLDGFFMGKPRALSRDEFQLLQNRYHAARAELTLAPRTGREDVLYSLVRSPEEETNGLQDLPEPLIGTKKSRVKSVE